MQGLCKLSVQASTTCMRQIIPCRKSSINFSIVTIASVLTHQRMSHCLHDTCSLNNQRHNPACIDFKPVLAKLAGVLLLLLSVQHMHGMQGGVQGSIRSWVCWDDIDAILYNIKDNRWCGNINRAHKSNGIYIIADLQAGLSAPGHPNYCCKRPQHQAYCPVTVRDIHNSCGLEVLGCVASML